jgi:hypothetical protein
VGLSNVQHTGLLGVLRKVLGESTGTEDRRKGELGNGDPALVAEARATARRRLGQGNPCTCRIYWRVEKG